ncbi:MAG: inositol monophosphatase [Verrucomicrobia bacterium]|nr:inositol monophosphatase [Verrucomicrobiota bacterium]
MTAAETKRALATAITAAQAAGKMMRDNLRETKKINEATQHDIKLELDVRCQKRIERELRRAFPKIPILGEEGILGDPEAPVRWVVDPIDGTVNFSYGIPHACVSIALQRQVPSSEFRVTGSKKRAAQLKTQNAKPGMSQFQSIVGVVYDPFSDEMWTAIRGQKSRLNGTVIHVSDRKKLDEAIVALGFAKQRFTLNKMLPKFNGLIHRVRKIRIMGAAALSLVYVATGRMDAYLEYGLRLWDIAAGGLIIECAGGEFLFEEVGDDYTYQILANNGHLARSLERVGN